MCVHSLSVWSRVCLHTWIHLGKRMILSWFTFVRTLGIELRSSSLHCKHFTHSLVPNLLFYNIVFILHMCMFMLPQCACGGQRKTPGCLSCLLVGSQMGETWVIRPWKVFLPSELSHVSNFCKKKKKKGRTDRLPHNPDCPWPPSPPSASYRLELQMCTMSHLFSTLCAGNCLDIYTSRMWKVISYSLLSR